MVGQLARDVDFPAQFGAGLLAIKRNDKNVRWSQSPGSQLGEQRIQVRACCGAFASTTVHLVNAVEPEPRIQVRTDCVACFAQASAPAHLPCPTTL